MVGRRSVLVRVVSGRLGFFVEIDRYAIARRKLGYSMGLNRSLFEAHKQRHCDLSQRLDHFMALGESPRTSWFTKFAETRRHRSTAVYLCAQALALRWPCPPLHLLVNGLCLTVFAALGPLG
jgi:hypothetical protein